MDARGKPSTLVSARNACGDGFAIGNCWFFVRNLDRRGEPPTVVPARKLVEMADEKQVRNRLADQTTVYDDNWCLPTILHVIRE